jgi:hypothetical protein
MARNKGTALRQDLRELMQESPMGSVNFMADEILPPIPVKETSSIIPVLSTSAGMKMIDVKRAPKGTFKRGEWVYGTDAYYTYEYGYEEPVDNVEALKNEEIFNEEVVSAQIAFNQVKLAREKRVADAVFNATTFAAAADLYTTPQEWDDATNANPFLDITAAHDDLFAKTGVPRSACHLLINDVVFRNILRADRVRNDVKYTMTIDTMSDQVKSQFLADFLGIKKVHVATSFYDSTALGIEDATFSKMWSNEYGMLYLPCPPSPSWKIAGLGRQPVWKKFSPDYKIESYLEEQSDSIVIRVREYKGEYVNKVFGVLMDNMTT